MAYEDKVVEVNVDLLRTATTATSGGDFNGIVTENTPSTTLTGLGTTPSPLKSTVNISNKPDNRVSVITSGGQSGLYVSPEEVKVSAKEGNTVRYITAEEATGDGNPDLEGVYSDPVNVTTTSPTKTITVKADSTGKSKTQIDVAVFSDTLNSLKVDPTGGLKVQVSPALDNTLEIRNGALYVRLQETKISQEAGNKIETKPDGIYVTTVKGDTGPQGPQGEQGLGIKVLATLDNVSDLPPNPQDYNDGDTFVIDGHFWSKTSLGGNQEWTDLGSFIGPDGLSAYEVAVQEGFVGTVGDWLLSLKGADGIGLRILGSFNDVSQLPTTGNQSGDAYIVQQQMWVWDSAQWSPVGQVGPEGKSAYQVWLDNGNTGSQQDFLASIKGEKGDTGAKGDQGLQGPAGTNANVLNLKGSKPTIGDLPATGNQVGDAWVVGTDVHGWTGTAWENYGPIRGPKGDQGVKGDTGLSGKSNYQIAVDNGFVGTESQWLATLKGAKGDQGVQGPRGINGEIGPKGDKGDGLKIDGISPDDSGLPSDPVLGETWLVGEDIKFWDGSAWIDGGPVRGPQGVAGATGPKGDKGDAGVAGERGPQGVQGLTGPAGAKGDAGPQGIQGPKGDQGIQGPAGPKGDTGVALTPKGTKPTVDDLPTDAVEGDFWTVDSVGYVWDGTTWVNMGNLRGDKGDTGEQGPQGEQGLQGPEGPKGDEGDVGPQGPQGEMGAGVKILGRKENTGELPSTGTLGEGYLIGQNFWVWDGTAYTDVGPIQGPKGDLGPQGPRGNQGIQGVKGDKGDKGDPGNIWILGQGAPSPVTGNQGDYYLDTTLQKIYLKTSPTQWEPLEGNLGGGNVYDAPSDSVRRVRVNGDWSAETQAQKISVVSTTAPVVDLGKQTVAFTLDNSGNTAKSITFTNVPASDFMLPISIVIKGNEGTLTWPEEVKWSGGTVPTYGASKSVIVLLWDGTEFLGTLGPNY